MELWAHNGRIFYYYYFLPPEHKRLGVCGEGLSIALGLDSRGEYKEIDYVRKRDFRGVSDNDLVNSYFHKVQDLTWGALNEVAMQDLIELLEGWGR